MTKLSEKILKEIKEKKIEPKPRWQFLLKDYFFWGAFGLSTFFGGVAFAVIIFVLLAKDWDLYRYLDKSFSEYLILTLPYVWLLVLGALFLLAIYNFKHTKNAYRQKPWVTVSASLILSLFLGALFFFSGLGQKIDEVFAKKIPYYENMIHRPSLWCHPDRGLLWGEIEKAENGDGFIIRGCQGQTWFIEKGENLGDLFETAEGDKIKIIGQQIFEKRLEENRVQEGVETKTEPENFFRALQMRPWHYPARKQIPPGQLPPLQGNLLEEHRGKMEGMMEGDE